MQYKNINGFLNNKNLSLRAKGLYLYICSKPKNWNFSVKNITKQTKDGKHAIQSALKELEALGLLQRKAKKNEQNKWIGVEYILKPLTDFQQTGKQTELLHKMALRSENLRQWWRNYEYKPKPLTDFPLTGNWVNIEYNILYSRVCFPNIDNVSIKPKKISKKTNIPFAEIISYLNKKANTKYRDATVKTKKLIKARWREGFTLADFKKVIDNKVDDWLADEKMSKYLRPETLFGSKFESYLNEKSNKKEEIIMGKKTI